MSFRLIKKHSPQHWELEVSSQARSQNLHLHQGFALLAQCTVQAVLTRFEFNSLLRIQTRFNELQNAQSEDGNPWLMINFQDVEEDIVRRLLEVLAKDKAIALHTLLAAYPVTPQPGFTELMHWLKSRPTPTWKKTELLRWAQNQPNLLRELCLSARANEKAEVAGADEETLVLLAQAWTEGLNLYLVRSFQDGWTTQALTVQEAEAQNQVKILTKKSLPTQCLSLQADQQQTRQWRVTNTGNVLLFRCEKTGAFGLLDPAHFKARERFFQKFDSDFYEVIFSSLIGSSWPVAYQEFVDLLCEKKTLSWNAPCTLLAYSDNFKRPPNQLAIETPKETVLLVDGSQKHVFKLPPQVKNQSLGSALVAAGYFAAVSSSAHLRLLDPEIKQEFGG